MNPQRGMRLHLVAGLVVLAVAGCGPATKETIDQPAVTVGAWQVVEMQQVESSTLDLGYGTSQWLYPLDAPKEKLIAEPEYESAAPVYYAAVFGDSADNVITLVIDASAGGGAYDRLYLDGNNDNRLDPATERVAFTMSTVSEHHPVRVQMRVSSGGRMFTHWADFTAYPYTDKNNPVEKIHANLRNASYWAGEAVFGDKRCKVAIADLDSNGLFNDVETAGSFSGDRFFADLDGDGSLKDNGDDGNSGHPYGRYTRIGDRWYAVVAASHGAEVRIAEARPPLGRVEAPARVVSVKLISASQPYTLHFDGGAAEGIAGTYQVSWASLAATDDRGRTWRTYASSPKDARPELTIPEGRAAKLPAMGEPLRVEPSVARGDDPKVLEIGIQIRGAGGESCRWPQSNPSASAAAIEVRDASGAVVVSAALKYG